MARLIVLLMLLSCKAEILTDAPPFWSISPECTHPCSESVARSGSIDHLGQTWGSSAPPPPPPHDVYHSPDEMINFGVPPLSPVIPDQEQLAEPPNYSDCRPVGRENTADGTTSGEQGGYYKIVSFDVDETPPPQENVQEKSADAQTSAQTCPSAVDVPRSPYSSDGQCGTRNCNGYGSLEATGEFNQNLNRKVTSCYRDSDCQFYYTDSAGLLNGEIVGRCTPVSSTLSTCDCAAPYFGNNCELKGCPKAMSGQKREHEILPGEATSPGSWLLHEDQAGDSGGGDAESQISAPYEGAVLGAGRRTLDSNRGGDAEHGFECGGGRGSCDYSRGHCVCQAGFYGRACEYRTSANRCSTNGHVDENCRGSAAGRQHHPSEALPDAEVNGLDGHYTPQPPCQYGDLLEPHCRPA